MSATTEALLVTASLLGMSLVSAYVTLVLMRGSAQVAHKGVRLGGATGMFVVTFVLLSQFMPEIRDGLVSEAQAIRFFSNRSSRRSTLLKRVSTFSILSSKISWFAVASL